MSKLNIDDEVSMNLIRMQMVNARKSKHLSQQQLSNITGLSTACISNIEVPGGDTSPNMKSIIKYLGALGLELCIRNIGSENDTPAQPPVETANVVQAKPILPKEAPSE